MKAVWIAHRVLRRIAEVDTRDPELVSGLVQINRAEIEQHIRRAEMENWQGPATRPGRLLSPLRLVVERLRRHRRNAPYKKGFAAPLGRSLSLGRRYHAA